MKITLTPEVAMALETMVSQSGRLEFSGFGWARIEGDALVMYDYVVLNVGSEAYTEIPAAELMKLLGREDAANMKVWLHRHPIGIGVPGPENWSGMDNNTIETNPLGGIPELVKWSAAIVRTPRGWVGRVDRHVPEHSVVHVPVEPSVPLEVFETIDCLKWERIKHLEQAAIERTGKNGHAKRADALEIDDEWYDDEDEYDWLQEMLDEEDDELYEDDDDLVYEDEADDSTYGPRQVQLW
jgi:hypothetical protein